MKTKPLLTILLFCTFISNAQSLIAYYPFNGNANDESGNNINTTYIGTGVTLTTDRFGNANKAYNFDGMAGSYMKMSADLLPMTNRTISLWFNVPDVTNRPGLLGYGGNGSCGTTLLMGINLLGIGQYYIQGHCGNNAAGYSYITAPINNWYHWVLTINGSTQKIYVNGQLKSTDNTFSGSTEVAGKDFSMGVITSISGTTPYTDANVGYLNGKLDDVRIYDAAMSDAQILQLYNMESTGLVAHYPFNGNANDESGNTTNPTYIGSGVTLTTDRFDNANKAYYFDGAVGSYIRIPADKFPATDRTISFWFNAEQIDNQPTPLSYGGDVCYNSLLMIINKGDYPNAYTTLSHCGSNLISAPYSISPVNKWQHLTMTISETIQKIFINGELQQTANTFSTPTVVTGKSAILGALLFSDGNTVYVDPTAGYFKGKLDDFRFYNAAMTDSDVKNLYNSEAVGLVAYYPFNGDANDESGNNNHGTLINNPTFTVDRFGNPDKAISFDKTALQLVNIPNNPSLQIGTELTLSVFVKRKTLAGNEHIINKGGEYNSGTCNYDLSFSDASFVFKYNGSYHVGYVVHDLNWHHYAITTYHGSTDVKFYIDGVYSPTWINGGTVDLKPATYSDLQIGGTIYYSNTTVDDVRIYNRILSPPEIANLYTNNALKIEKFENVATNNFYVRNNTLYFENTLNLENIKTVEVYNLLGQKVFNTSKIKAEIFLNYLKKGVYILKVENNDGKISSLKFLME